MNNIAALKGGKAKKLPSPPAFDERLRILENEPAPSPASHDGRSINATGMVELFSTRLLPGTRQKIKEAAVRDQTTMGKVIMESFALYEEKKKR